MAALSRARQRSAGLAKAAHGVAGPGRAYKLRMCCCCAWRGSAQLRSALQGLARFSKAQQRPAAPGKARHGLAALSRAQQRHAGTRRAWQGQT
eukprot:6153147-Pyramimonas_sp.AAC.1